MKNYLLYIILIVCIISLAIQLVTFAKVIEICNYAEWLYEWERHYIIQPENGLSAAPLLNTLLKTC